MTVDFKPVASDPAANVIDQATFLLALAPGGSLEHGFKAGTAQSAEVNKPVRQSSMMTAALANLIAEVLAVDVLDDGDVDALKTKLRSAFLSTAWSTGDAKLTMKTVADSGWIMADDGTIGKAGSGASQASDLNKALFLFMWTQYLDPQAPVVGGRGPNALGDWDGGKKLTIPKQLGRALAVAGAGAGLTARALGLAMGEEKHMQAANEVAPHNHPINDPGHGHGVTDPGHVHFNAAGNITYVVWNNGADGEFDGHSTGGFPTDGTLGNMAAAVTNISIDNAGTGVTVLNSVPPGGVQQGMNVMQPTSFAYNVMIKQ